ncbi:transglutaminase family protein [Rhodobacteraceae bacterium N5(2021)]|uniref:Transglutaminase family protein n=1 Tax=Gymnodinialimonas phycosphaerae TaxID=2841589 RepID=A0A975YHC5_9RHOB|nr:transglutaminase family protein [Gymnodinialimonas phycosphaerae]MBY4892526.1 transglutaminase family protein [Gymnodinialimonas phycosphaerae]
MQLTISHTTTYQFDEPAHYGLQQLRLTPPSYPGLQTVQNWNMKVTGGRVETTFRDQHQNHVALVSFDDGAHEIRVLCEGQVTVEDTAGVVGPHIVGKNGHFAPLWYFQRTTALTTAGPLVLALLDGLAEEMPDDLPRLHALSARILDAVPYTIGATGAETNAEGAVAAGGGVCQDHAHIFITAARAMGYPARYISGYLMMSDRIHQDASHAWAEAHVPGIGWVGFDVSNGYSPDPRYVRVASGLDYSEAAPISGLHYGASGEAMSVDIQVAQQ